MELPYMDSKGYATIGNVTTNQPGYSTIGNVTTNQPGSGNTGLESPDSGYTGFKSPGRGYTDLKSPRSVGVCKVTCIAFAIAFSVCSVFTACIVLIYLFPLKNFDNESMKQNNEDLRYDKDINESIALHWKHLLEDRMDINTINISRNKTDQIIISVKQSISNLRDEYSKLGQKLRLLEAEKLTLQNDVNQLKEGIKKATDSRMVVFAGRRGEYKAIGNGNIIKFLDIDRSIGGGYNVTDGIFHCPVRGWYLIHITITAYQAVYASASLRLNNIRVMDIYSGETNVNAQPSGSRSIALHLDVRDRISLVSSGDTYSYYCSLSITLISKL